MPRRPFLAFLAALAACGGNGGTDDGGKTGSAAIAQPAATTSQPPSASDAKDAAMPGVQSDGTVVSAVPWFEGTLEQALTHAKASGKLVLVDVGAYWCEPCQKLDEEVFVREDVGKFVAERFVALHVEADLGEGGEVVDRFDVLAYPTLLVLESSGLEKGRIVDFVAPALLMSTLERIAAGGDPLAELRTAVEAEPDDAKARYRLAEALALAARREEAEREYEIVLVADPKDELGLASAVQYDRAFYFAYKMNGDRERAVAELRELQRRFPGSRAASRAHRQIGRILADMGRHDEAIASLDAMLAMDPEDLALVKSYGWFSFRERCRPDAGLRVVDAAIAHAPEDAELAYLRGELLHLVGRDADAAVAMRRASDLQPTSAFYRRQARRFDPNGTRAG